MLWNPDVYNQFKKIRYQPFFDLSDFISDDTAREIIKQKLGARKPEFLESNMKAYDLGRKIGLSN